MTEDYGCKVCGKHFEEEADLKSHGKDDHPEFNEMYAKEAFKCEDCGKEFPDLDAGLDHRLETNHNVAEEQDKPFLQDEDDEFINVFNDIKSDEIDQQEDKPIQTHDDWQKELEGLKDEFATEQEKCAICNGEHPTAEHPVVAQEEETKTVIDPIAPATEEDDYYPKDSEGHIDSEGNTIWDVDRKAEEEGGADAPLKKVDDLSESYRYMSKDHRANLFESLDFTQGDSAILAGLEWNELTRPIKVEASEAYAKEEEPEEETGEDPEEEEVNKAYENLYNLEKYHASPDYKKKAIECNRCNEKFYNINDRSIHFNEVHATEQEYILPEQCPYCNQLIQEPENLDWHMQEQHGAHVPSQFTQTGIDAGMSDTDLDSLESRKKASEVEEGNPDDWEPHIDEEGNFIFRKKEKDAEEGGAGSGPQEGSKPSLLPEQVARAGDPHYNPFKATPPSERLQTDPALSRMTEGESKSELEKEIKELENFINIASHENPMNMGAHQDKLDALKSELSTATEEEDEGWGPNWGSPEETSKDIYELTHPDEDKEEAEEQEEVECEDCGEKFNDSAQLEEHQYANWHGKHKDDYEGQDMPRNVMGGQ